MWQASHRLSPPQAPALARSSSRRTVLPGGSAGDGKNGSPAAASAKTNVFASAAATAVASAGSVLARARESDNGLAAAGLCRSGFVAGALFGVGDGMWGAGIGEGGVRPRLVTVPPRSGVHAYVYESGDTYVGNWKNGRRHGVGVYEERATGNSYEVSCRCCCCRCCCLLLLLLIVLNVTTSLLGNSLAPLIYCIKVLVSLY